MNTEELRQRLLEQKGHWKKISGLTSRSFATSTLTKLAQGKVQYPRSDAAEHSCAAISSEPHVSEPLKSIHVHLSTEAHKALAAVA